MKVLLKKKTTLLFPVAEVPYLSRRLSPCTKSKRIQSCTSILQSVGVALYVLLARRLRCSFLWGSPLGRRSLRLSWGCATHHSPLGPKDSTPLSLAVSLVPWEPPAVPSRHEIADVEGRRNSPIGWNGDVVGVGIDFPTNLERTGGARM